MTLPVFIDSKNPEFNGADLYCPKIHYVLAIHGSPYWFATTTLSELNRSGGTFFEEFSSCGGEVLDNLAAIPTISQEIDVMGGISTLSDISFELVENDDKCSKFFRSSSYRANKRYTTRAVGRADSAIFLSPDNVTESADGLLAGQTLQFSRECMVIDTIVGNQINVLRSVYSAFEHCGPTSGPNLWPEKYPYFYQLGSMQGTTCVISDSDIKGHFSMNGRWCVLYRFVQHPNPSRGYLIDVPYSGVLSDVEQSGVGWKVTTKSVMSLLSREINVTMAAGRIQPAWWLSGSDATTDDQYPLVLKYYMDSPIECCRWLTWIDGKDTGKTWEDINNELLTNLLTANIDPQTGRWEFYNSVGLFDPGYGAGPLGEDHVQIAPCALQAPLRCENVATMVGGNGHAMWFSTHFKDNAVPAKPCAVWIAHNGLFQLDPSTSANLFYDEFIDGEDYTFYLIGDVKRYVTATCEYSGSVPQFRCQVGTWKDENGVILTRDQMGCWGDRIEFTINRAPANGYFLDEVIKHIASTDELFISTFDSLPAHMALGFPHYLFTGLESFSSAIRESLKLAGCFKIEKSISLKSLIENDLKLLGVALYWSSVKGLSFKVFDPPTYLNIRYNLGEDEIITRTPSLSWGYVSPLNRIVYKAHSSQDTTNLSIADQDAAVGSTRSLELQSNWVNGAVETTIPGLIAGNLYDKLRWLGNNTPKLTVSVPYSIWRNIDIGDNITITHPFVTRMGSGSGYGIDEVPCVVIGKAEGLESTLDVIFRSNIDTSNMAELAPTLEVDLARAGTSYGWASADKKIYLKHTFSPDLSYDLQFLFQDRTNETLTTPDALRWYASDGTLGSEINSVRVTSISGAQDYITVDEYTPDWLTMTPERVFLTIKDFNRHRQAEDRLLPFSKWDGTKWDNRDLHEGLIACYNLQDNYAGTFVFDAHKKGYGTATANTSLLYNASGKLSGGCLDFRSGATNDGIAFSGLEPSRGYYIGTAKPFSMSFWINQDTTVAYAFVFGYANFVSPANGFVVIFNNTTRKLSFEWTQDASNYATIVANTTALTNGQWYHVLMAYDGATPVRWNNSNVRIWINGIEQSRTARTDAGTVTSGGSNATHYLACPAGITAYDFDGKMNQVALWSRALDLYDSLHLYNGGAGVPYM